MIGEHIRALKGGRWVHAIDCGDETVLHLAEEPAPRRVRRAYRPEFLAGAASVEAVTHRERTFAAKEVVRRAYSRASDPTLAAMFGDSEAFAEWCTTGRIAGPRNLVPPAMPGPAGPTAPAAPARPRRLARTAKAAPKPRKASGRRKASPKRNAARRAAPRRKPARRRGSRR